MDSFVSLCSHEVLVLGFGIIVGLSLHFAVFNQGEWHLQAPKIVTFHCWLLIIFCITHAYYGQIAAPVFRALTLLSAGFYVSLITSIVIYRLKFHPLTKTGFPGPTAARITKLWHVWSCRNSKNHLVLDALHKKYGDFVRTGPAEITVFRPEVFWAVDGPGTSCVKSDWYDLLAPSLALVTARVKPVHANRRREWKRGFTAEALVKHEQRLTKHIDRLEECITADVGADASSEMRDLFYWFGFDTMGDFVFNKSFEMLVNRKWHHIILRLQRSRSLLGPLSPAPWLIQVGFKLGPRVSVIKDCFDMVAWCGDQTKDRLKVTNKEHLVPDLTHYLMECGGERSSEERGKWMEGDSLLAIVAGSEPTASTLLSIFYELCRNPDYIEKIYEEVKDIHMADARSLSKLPYLNGAINEALRLHPALLTGGARKTTEQGTWIAGQFIPSHTTIIAPRYSIARREDCFVRPKEFIPERWFRNPELILNVAAYTPFGTSQHSCLGRFLATDIMRLVVTRLVQKFGFGFAPGETGLRMTTDLRDYFTSAPGRLELSFQLRESS